VPSDAALPEIDVTGADLQAALVSRCERRLRALASRSDDGPEPELRVFIGTPFLEVIRDVLREGRDLVITCAETRRGQPFASDEMHLLRKCPCPVWLYRPSAAAGHRRIVAAIDVDPYYPANERRERQQLNVDILETAAALALADGAELHVVHAWDAIGEHLMRGGLLAALAEDQIGAYVTAVRRGREKALEATLAELGERIGAEAVDRLHPVRHLPKGSVTEQLPAQIERIGADLLVLGTVGRSGIAGLLIGNTAEAVVHQVACSVMALKPPGFVSPVAP
jgi:nucleotide-binding universal stress UspA family protein